MAGDAAPVHDRMTTGQAASQCGDIGTPCRRANRANRRAAVAASAGLAALACAGCGLSVDREESEAVAERYFQAISGREVADALPLYAPAFFDATPRDRWLELLRDVRARCGIQGSHSLTSWRVMNRVGTDGGSTATLVFDVHYASCQLTETITVGKADGGERRISGHLMKPEGPGPGKPGPAMTTA